MRRASRRPAVAIRGASFVLGLGLLAVAASAAPPPVRGRPPHAGYAYPAGGRVGTTFIVNVGGQYLRSTEGVRISGDGVSAKLLMVLPPPRNLDNKQRRELQRRLQDIRQRRVATTPGRGAPVRKGKKKSGGTKPAESVKLPEHPLLENLDTKSLAELREVAHYFFSRRSPLQRKRAIEEIVKIRVTIEPGAGPGVRDLRLVTKSSISNPLRFYVGLLPETREQEPFPPSATEELLVDPPVVINGQIFPRDADRYKVRARKGQRLVCHAEARGIVPYQADSVPGWMQTTLTLYDPAGREVAYADEYRFDPDPVLFYEVPKDGEYVLEIQDAIARGRDDFVYRVTVGELPFVTRVFPLGGQAGSFTNAEVRGWNLGRDRVPLDMRAGRGRIRETTWRVGDGMTNEVVYAVDTLPERLENEPNDAILAAQDVAVPTILDGRIGRPDDVDVFAFAGRGGKEVAIEVTARVLGSPLDSLIRLTDAEGHVVAWNDDHAPEGLEVRALGLQTHHADSYLRTKLPKTGTYYVHVSDVTQHGSEEHAYRLRIGPPMPDVDLYVVPSSINVSAGRAALISVCAVRKDGFDGEIEVELLGAPEGFDLGGATIPTGQDRVTMSLTAPREGYPDPIPLELVGRVRIDRKDVVRPVVPADDVMQAFLWRHIVPARELVVKVAGKGGRWIPVVSMDDENPVRVPIGGKGVARFAVKGRVQLEYLRFVLIDPPKGLSLGKAKTMGSGFTLEFLADRSAVRTGDPENLIVEAFVERKLGKNATGKRRAKRQKDQVRRYSLGFLPAVPIQIVRR